MKKNKKFSCFLLGLLVILPATILCRPSLELNENYGEVIEGDIILPSPSQSQKEKSSRNGDSDVNTRWPLGEIPYAFDDSEWPEEQRKILQKAFDVYESKTCIRFRERTPDDFDYVTFSKLRPGCNSAIGRLIGQQYIFFQDECFYTFGTILHELLHTIGFYHEHNRPDRDDYVTIKFENVLPGAERWFNKLSKTSVNDFGVSYDYGSIMHYYDRAFSKNGEVTIVPKDPNAMIGQRTALSEKDIQKVNLMYKDICPKHRQM